MGNVERGGGFVEQQGARVAGQHLGDEHQLPLAAAQCADAPMRERGDPDFRHRRLRRGQIPRRHPQAKRAHATKQHDFERRQHRARCSVLRHVADVGLPTGPGYPAGMALHAGQRAQKSRFARPVGPKNRQNLAGLGHEIDVHNGMLRPIPNADVAGLEPHVAPPRRSTSQAKNGTPISAVTMPMGKTVPGTIALLATDAADSSSAPIRADAGMAWR